MNLDLLGAIVLAIVTSYKENSSLYEARR